MSRLPLFFLLAGLLVVITLPPAAQAQDADEERDNQSLPDIAPREIEIRGQLEISFPELERQPLAGFNPPPSIPSVPSDHQPFVEEYKQETEAQRQQLPGRANLPLLLDRPTPRTGELEAQVGRYISRTGRARFDLPLSDRERLGIKVDYEGLDRFSPFRGEDISAPHDTFEGQFGFQTNREAFSVGFDLDGFLDRYTLYGMHPHLDDGTPEIPDREGAAGGGTLWVRSQGSVPATFEVRYGESRYASFFPYLQGSDRREVLHESRLDLSAEVAPRISGRVVEADFTLALSDLDGEPGIDPEIAFFSGGAAVQMLSSATMDLRAGARLFVLTDRVIGDEVKLYPAPDVRLDWRPMRQLSVYARNAPSGQKNALADLFEANPFLEPTPTVRPSVFPIDAEGGARLFLGRFQLAAQAGYRQSPNYRFFEAPQETSSLASGMFSVEYGSAHILYGGGELAYQYNRNVHFGLRANYRRGQLLDDENALIPNFAPVTADGFLSFAFADQQGIVQLTGTLESARYIDRTNTTRIAPYFHLNLRGSYDITPAFGVVGEIRNMTTGYLERWQGYPRPSFLIRTGVRIRL